MKAVVVWYNANTGKGEATTSTNETIIIYERSFKSGYPQAGDTIVVMRTKEFPGIGLYAESARITHSKTKSVKALKSA